MSKAVWHQDWNSSAPRRKVYINDWGITVPLWDGLKSTAVVEVERLQKERDELQGQVAKLKDQNDWQSRQITLQAERLKPNGKQALYIRLDGATQIKAPMYGERGPMSYYRQAVLRSRHVYGVSSYENSPASVPIEHEEFRLIAETEPYYIYEQTR